MVCTTTTFNLPTIVPYPAWGKDHETGHERNARIPECRDPMSPRNHDQATRDGLTTFTPSCTLVDIGRGGVQEMWGMGGLRLHPQPFEFGTLGFSNVDALGEPELSWASQIGRWSPWRMQEYCCNP